MRTIQISIYISCCLFLFGCAGSHPNPGERTVDINWEAGNYSRALTFLQPPAERGEPWAQLRMGMYYELGIGVQKDPIKALEWFKKVAV